MLLTSTRPALCRQLTASFSSVEGLRLSMLLTDTQLYHRIHTFNNNNNNNRHFKNAQLMINCHKGARGDTETKPNTYTSTFSVNA